MDRRVIEDPAIAGAYLVRIDGVDHSWVDPDDPTRMDFDYMQRIATHLDVHAPAGQRLRVIHLGGAGMSLARYVAHTRPTSPQIVCEPDAALTEEVREVIPLPRNSGIKVRPIDARAGVAAMPDDYADVVILDAFANGQVPGELATVEFFGELRRILRTDGLMLMNITDIGALEWTRRTLAGIRRYWPHVAVSTESATLKGRRFGNIVVAASVPALPVAALARRAAGAAFPYRLVVGTHLDSFVGGAQPFYDGAVPSSPPPPHGRSVFT